MVGILALNWIINIGNIDHSVVYIWLIKETGIRQALVFKAGQVCEWKKTGYWALERHRDEMTINMIHVVDCFQIVTIWLRNVNTIKKPETVFLITFVLFGYSFSNMLLSWSGITLRLSTNTW
jgi:hypothetical protein